MTCSAPASPGYGYNPAVAALISRLKEKLKGSCLPRPLTINADGSLPCAVIEVVPGSKLNGVDCATYCKNEQRNVPNPPTPQMSAAVLASMKQSNLCDEPGGPTCSSMCLCELPQETGANLTGCQNDDDATANQSLPPGYCYIDATLNPPLGDPSLVAKCPETERRILRFVGNCPTCTQGVAVPLGGAIVYTACQGSAITAAAAATATPVVDAGP